MDLSSLTISEASRLIRTKQISPVELTQAYLERIDKINPLLNCFITITPEIAMQQARQVEKTISNWSKNDGLAKPLTGIPIALKDLYDTQGIRTTAGSSFFRDYIPEKDAQTVKKLKQAGAILLGKLNLHEIALGVTNVNPHYGACRNPWDLSRVSGGSSGGSAVAIAADLCLGSLGSDSGGSIRIPASLCGVTGLKPTYGRVSLRGVFPLSWNTDHAGPMAKNVRDTATLLQVIAGYDPQDPYSIKHQRVNYLNNIQNGISGWRVALASDRYLDKTDPQVWQAIKNAAAVFDQLGGMVETVEFPGMYEAALANSLMVPSDAAAFHRGRLAEHPEGFGEDVLRRLTTGAAFTSSEYILARRTQTLLRRQFEHFFDQYDLLILPATPVTAPLIEGPDAVEQARLLTRYTAPFNLTGLPALTVPCGFTSAGLPVGLQIVARPWSEAKLIQAGYAFEQATQWQNRKPTIEKT